MKVIINPKYNFLRTYIEQLPSKFINHKGEIIYEARNILKKTEEQGVTMVVKSFKKPHIINRFAYTFIRKSKARRSYEYSMNILKHGSHTPEPIAYIEEYSGGLISHSFYICCYEAGDTVRNLMAGKVSGNEKELNAFVDFTKSLHDNGILHLDYSPGNILMRQNTQGNYEFSLVDVNRMHLINGINCKEVCWNLRRLCLSKEVLDYIVTRYATLMGWNKDAAIKIAANYSDQFFVNFMYRRTIKRSKNKNIRTIAYSLKCSRQIRIHLDESSNLYKFLLQKERKIYKIHFSRYDYRKVLTPEYQ